MLESFVSHLFKEWEIVWAAPAAIAFISIAAFSLSFAWHREVISRLKQQKQIRDDDLAYLRDKTGAPDLKGVIERVASIEEELRKAGEIDFAKVFEKGLRISDLPQAP